MTKSGIRIFADRSADGLTEPPFPALPKINALKAASLEGYLDKMLSALKARDQGAQAVLREDLTSIYEVASKIRDDAALFERFASSGPVVRLPRAPKTAEQTLHALLKLAYAPKLASARHVRLKALWTSKAAVDEVYAELQEIGSSPKGIRAIFEPRSLIRFGLEHPSVGAEFDLYIQARVASPGRISCTIVHAEKRTDSLGLSKREGECSATTSGFRGSFLP